MKRKRTHRRNLRTVAVVHMGSRTRRRMSDSELAKRIVALNPHQRDVLLRRLSELSVAATAATSSGVKHVEVEAANSTMRRMLIKLARNPYAKVDVGSTMSAVWVDIGRAMREGLKEERRALAYERP